MAVEAERLLAVFEARFASLEKALDKARKNSNRAFTSIEKDGSRAENALANVGRRATPQIDNATKALSRTRFETGNLAAQFQDIGVQLAGGQSPFLIALQQGTQLNQMLGQAGARGAVSMLGGALASLVNPISIATIATIGLGGAAVQYFASLMQNSEPAAASLKEQADLIHRVAERWGEALPALKAYSDELKRQQDEAERTRAAQYGINQQFEEARKNLPDVRTALGGVVQELIRAGAAQADIDAVRNALNEADRAAQDLRQGLADGSATTEDFERLQRALANLLSNESVSANEAAASSVLDLRDAYLDAADAAREFRREENAAAAKGGRVGGETMDEAQARFDSLRQFRERIDPDAFSGVRRGTPASQSADSGGRSSAAAAAERERDAVRQLIDDLRFERSIIGLSAVEREKANALRRAGAAATDEEAREIMRLIDVTHAHQQAVEQQEQAYKTLEQAGKTAMNGLITAMADGKIEAEELLSVLLQVAQQMLSMNGGGGGILSWLFGGIGGSNFTPNTTAFRFFSGQPGFATGTANTGGNRGDVRGIVHGQEAVIPLPNNGKVPVQINGGGGGSSVLEVRLSSELVGQILQKAEGQAVRISQAALTAYDKSMPDRISYINSHPKRR